MTQFDQTRSQRAKWRAMPGLLLSGPVSVRRGWSGDLQIIRRRPAGPAIGDNVIGDLLTVAKIV